MKLRLGVLVGVGILLASALNAAAGDEGGKPAACLPYLAKTVEIGQQAWNVRVAYTATERERGLSGQTTLLPGEGLWFVLPGADFHGFWMKDMRFPIDLVWITPDLRVADVMTLPVCQPQSPCPVYTPPRPVSFVLELGAGTFSGNKNAAVTWRCTP